MYRLSDSKFMNSDVHMQNLNWTWMMEIFFGIDISNAKHMELYLIQVGDK
jgi:hypothetical protein